MTPPPARTSRPTEVPKDQLYPTPRLFKDFDGTISLKYIAILDRIPKLIFTLFADIMFKLSGEPQPDRRLGLHFHVRTDSIVSPDMELFPPIDNNILTLSESLAFSGNMFSSISHPYFWTSGATTGFYMHSI